MYSVAFALAAHTQHTGEYCAMRNRQRQKVMERTSETICLRVIAMRIAYIAQKRDENENNLIIILVYNEFYYYYCCPCPSPSPQYTIYNLRCRSEKRMRYYASSYKVSLWMPHYVWRTLAATQQFMRWHFSLECCTLCDVSIACQFFIFSFCVFFG